MGERDGLAAYDAPSKEAWRTWAWREIYRRAKPDGIVLYLVGPNPEYDAVTALEAGFSALNLVGVDREPLNVNRARQAGLLCVHGELAEVAAYWSLSPPISAILADYTSAARISTLRDMYATLRWGLAGGAAAVVNLQRGRDADTNDIRRGLARGTSDRDLIINLYATAARFLNVDSKHRGLIALYWMTELLRGNHQLRTGRQSLGEIDAIGAPIFRGSAITNATEAMRALKNFQPTFYSYRSNIVTMDSMAVTWPHQCGQRVPQRFADEDQDDLHMRRQIAAVCATRTRRLRG